MARNTLALSLSIAALGLMVAVGTTCVPTYIYEYPGAGSPGSGDPVPGPEGKPGLACWDLDGDGVADPEEDINQDGQVDALDCGSGDPVPGPDGPQGKPGLACWDLDGDGVADPEEDINQDGQVDALDCQAGAGLRLGAGLLLQANVLSLDNAYLDSFYWRLGGNTGTVAGSNYVGTTDAQPLDLYVNSTRALRLVPNETSPNLIGGFKDNSIGAGFSGSTIGGGGQAEQTNDIYGDFGTIGGGRGNRIGTEGAQSFPCDATISGGRQNRAAEVYAAVGGGLLNIASGSAAVVAGGQGNEALGFYGSIGGGYNNKVRGNYGTVGGGANNFAGFIGDPFAEGYSTVPGGLDNEALADYSFAAGRMAKVGAGHRGAMLFADSKNLAFNSAAANEFAVRATGGVRLVTGVDPTAGARLAAGSGTWSALSDRQAKEHFAPVDERAILDRVTDLSIETWNYRAEGPAVRHIGPMAQDFRQAFGLGDDARYITTVDVDGVALAAIKGLRQLVREKEGELAAQQRRIDDLEARMAKLQGEMASLAELNEAVRGRVAGQAVGDGRQPSPPPTKAAP